MNIEWIIVLVIMIVMNAFIFLALWAARQRAEFLVRKNFYFKLADCERLAEKRLADLEQVESDIQHYTEILEELKQRKQAEEASGGQSRSRMSQRGQAAIIKPVLYRNTDLIEQYSYIKKNWDIDVNEIVERILAEKRQETDVSSSVYEKILEKLSFTVQLQLLSEYDNVQVEVLRELLTPEENNILDIYLTECEKEGKFNIFRFADYVEQEIAYRKDILWVYTSDDSNPLNKQYTNVKWKQDLNILEGCVIRYKTQVFDYSL